MVGRHDVRANRRRLAVRGAGNPTKNSRRQGLSIGAAWWRCKSLTLGWEVVNRTVLDNLRPDGCPIKVVNRITAGLKRPESEAGVNLPESVERDPGRLAELDQCWFNDLARLVTAANVALRTLFVHQFRDQLA